MGMTIVEKILARGAGKSSVRPGEFATVKLDFTLATDATAPMSIKTFRQMGAEKVFDPEKIALVNDHFVPAKDIQSAELCKVMRDFAREQNITHFYDIGRSGICHTLVTEEGLVAPSDVAMGADSHSCTWGALGCFATGVGSTDLAGAWALGETWVKVPPSMNIEFKGKPGPYTGGKDFILLLLSKITVDGGANMALEFTGEGIENLTMDGRFTVVNMTIETGGKCGIIAYDDVTEAYCRHRVKKPFEPLYSDPDAEYAVHHVLDVEGLPPLVAEPFSPDKIRPVDEIKGVKLDQVVIGSCTNGRLSDLREAASFLQGKKVSPFTRLIIMPGTTAIFHQAMKEGLMDIFTEAGGLIAPAGCGPCLGGHMGVLGEGEVALSTTSRNFVGRMGARGSRVYLSNPAVAAASAVAGEIMDPRSVQSLA